MADVAHSTAEGTAWRFPCELWLGVLLSFIVLFPTPAGACRLLPAPPEIDHVLWVHVEGPCTPEERQKLAVSGQDVLHALEQGRSVQLENVLVVGEMMLDQLPLHEVTAQADIPDPLRERLNQRRLSAVRIIPTTLSIRHSHIQKVLATNLEAGALLMLGPVDFTGSVFQQSVDFSKTIFWDSLEFSGVRVDYEAFFIGAEFEKDVNFAQTDFGTHSRFHKAVFRESAIFAGARFMGVAEFLEVEFRKQADLSGSRFVSGAGFSGSVFGGQADFSSVTFDHEIYFRFAVFKEPVSFQDAEFHKVADFSNAEFDGNQNFSGAQFAEPPVLDGTDISPQSISDQGWGRQNLQWALFAGLVIVVVFYLWMTREKKRA